MSPEQKSGNLKEVWSYFFRLGLLGFGGPLALAAQMQRELIDERRWMKTQSFQQAFALIKAMPGPVAFQTAVFLGRARAGSMGGLTAGLAINLPPFFLMILFGVFYRQLQAISAARLFLEGMQAAALGVILSSIKNLAMPHRAKLMFWAVSAGALIFSFFLPSYEPILIISCGAFTTCLFLLTSRNGSGPILKQPSILIAGLDFKSFMYGPSIPAIANSISPNFFDLTWSCFKAGAFVFGSGLAIVPMMESDFVSRLGWLTQREFMDALTFGQITPGPVVITATFIGFKSLGFIGAVVATLSIYAAPFFHMMTWFPRFVERLSTYKWIAAFLTGAIGAVVGSLLAATVRLAMPMVGQPIVVPLIVGALVIAIYSKFPAWALIPAGGAVAWLASFVF